MRFLYKKEKEEKEIIFDNHYLPMLIHGTEGSGASYFSVTMTAHFYTHGEKLFFFTAKKRAKEEFESIAGNYSGDAIFCPSGDTQKAIELLSNMEDKSERIIFIKNVEDILSLELFNIAEQTKMILSGDFGKLVIKNEVLNFPYETKILFSEIDSVKPPLVLEKFEAYIDGRDLVGKVKLV